MFKDILLKMREEKNISQTQIALDLGTKQTTYSNWERGEREPNIEMLIKIANYYHISLDYLTDRYKK